MRQLAVRVLTALALTMLLYVVVGFTLTGFFTLWRLKLEGDHPILCGRSGGYVYVMFKRGDAVYLASIDDSIGYVASARPIVEGKYVPLSCTIRGPRVAAFVLHQDKRDLPDSYYLVEAYTGDLRRVAVLKIQMPGFDNACPPPDCTGASLGTISWDGLDGVLLEADTMKYSPSKGVESLGLHVWIYLPSWSDTLSTNITFTPKRECIISAGALPVSGRGFSWRRSLLFRPPVLRWARLALENASVRISADYVIIDVPVVVNGSKGLMEISVSRYGSIQATLTPCSGREQVQQVVPELRHVSLEIEELLGMKLPAQYNITLIEVRGWRESDGYIYAVATTDEDEVVPRGSCCSFAYTWATILVVAGKYTDAIDYVRVLWSGRPVALLAANGEIYVVTWSWYGDGDTYYLYKLALVRPLRVPVYAYILLSTYWHGSLVVLLFLVASVALESYRSLLEKLRGLEAEEPGEGEE